MEPRIQRVGRRTTIVIHSFVEDLGTIHGTPLVSVRLAVSPFLKISTLKYMACYAFDFLEDMMALMVPKRFSPEEHQHLRRMWSPASFSQPYPEHTPEFIAMLQRRKLDENLTVGKLETKTLGISIDIDWLRRCLVCGHENYLSEVRRSVGCDNIPDLNGSLACANPECSEHVVRKMFNVRIARMQLGGEAQPILPLITSVCNGAAGTVICGRKTHPPMGAR